MNTQELKDKYRSLYEYMANSKKPENMKTFGRVMTAMMDDLIDSNTSKAEEYIGELESVKWRNYLTPAEAEKIVSKMEPKSPWSLGQWKSAMEQNGFPLEGWPYYNKCALYVTMSMIMSDSSSTLVKFVGSGDIFKFAYALAIDKLKDEDERFKVREYFFE